jgi:EAL domain-containing protein (putative c-di-GMP-specific phosphodiesterase class I)
VFAEDIDLLSGRLSELRTLGVRIAVDDFGTGYSSLGHLSRFEIDYLKIARPFVVGIESPQNDAAIARAIVYLAESFGLEVIAEGIENQAQVTRLLSLGCKRGQGFHLSLPLSASAITKLVTGGTADADAIAQAETTG